MIQDGHNRNQELKTLEPKSFAPKQTPAIMVHDTGLQAKNRVKHKYSQKNTREVKSKRHLRFENLEKSNSKSKE